MKAKEKEQARLLRRNGLSLKEICQHLNVSKGSVSIWVRDIKLTEKQERELNKRVDGYRNKMAGANKLKELSNERCKRYRSEGYALAENDEVFRVLCGIYWGDGTKDKNVFSITNCDAKMLDIFCRWLIKKGYDKKIMFRVYYYADNGLSEESIEDWWLNNINGLKRTHFRKFTVCEINRASQKKRVGKQLYGTATLSVCSTELVQNVYGGIQYVQDMLP